MEGDPTQTDQTTAEPAGAASPSPAATAQADPAPERKELASIADALRHRTARPEKPDAPPPADASSTPTDSGTARSSATPASNPDEPKPSSAATPDDPKASEAGDSAATASKPDTEDQDTEGKAPGQQEGKPSRRERAEIRDLTTERDALKSEVEQLRSALTIPDHIKAAAIDARLPDDEFNRLSAKKQREDVTGEYLTPEESERFGRALQVREWSSAWYVDAQQQAASWVSTQRQQMFDEQAQALAPVLKESDYLKPDPISRAASWADVYRYIRDASREDGVAAGRAELQPKLDEAQGRIHDLEAELKDLRHGRANGARTFERGGVSSGAFSSRPDPRTASASDLFAAAIDEAERKRSRRAVGAR